MVNSEIAGFLHLNCSKKLVFAEWVASIFDLKMPQIVFDPLGGLNSFLRQMPIPTLNSYITMSLLLSSVSWYHVHNLFLDREVGLYI